MSDQNSPFLIVGLGNPGREYRDNRHNVGFMQVDMLVERFGVRFTRMESKALVAKADYAGQRVILAKPQTYMNLSGQSVSSLLNFYKVQLSNFLVTFDDADLPFGLLRLRPKGGSSGQKGMRSIIERLGSQEFPRLRIGIGRPPGQMQVPDYVLQDFSKTERETVLLTLQRGADAIQTFIADGLEKAMNLYNGSLQDNETD